MTATPRVPDGKHLARLRWAVRAVLALGVAASIAANVLHAPPNLISQMIAAWPPLALLLTVELISRVPADRRGLAALRLIAAAVIAGIAAWVSYWHMVGVAARYGETNAAASYLLPISVDGLVVVASISLVEIAERIHTSFTNANDDREPVKSPYEARTPEPDLGRKADQPANGAVPLRDGEPPRAVKMPARAETTAGINADTPQRRSASSHADSGVQSDDLQSPARSPVNGEDVGNEGSETSGHDGDDAVVPSSTPAAVAYWYRRDPSLHPAEIAARIGRSERTVRRHWPPTLRTTNGHDASRLAGRLRGS